MGQQVSAQGGGRQSGERARLGLHSGEIEKLLCATNLSDHGVEYMGTDESIVQAARVSYGAGTKQLLEDRGLIRYLPA